MIVLIDNYDSFTYNLVQYLAELKAKIKVFRNDKVTLEKISKIKPSQIVISPGPGGPEDAGISCDLIRSFAGKIPILGVCLGHQCIGAVFGGRIVRASCLMHGKVSKIYHCKEGIFKGIPSPFLATRYHSLAVSSKDLPKSLQVTAWTKDGQIMGLRHKDFAIWGVQFHPESIMTEHGKKLLANFLAL
ncbi:MAG: aminodeoxychorismate/anthranilate synthase component II [Candidatus Omnitrophica bacterium]|nr:aminodeoxychorismate/anthranilate synthase component II [Candidatus Omnitrophota bacterium]